MKTRELRFFLRKISELNNTITHYEFVWEQFRLEYLEGTFWENNKEKLSSDIFNRNKFKNDHNVKINLLSKEHGNVRKSILEGVFVFEYTLFEAYLKNLLIFLSDLDTDTKSFDPQEGNSQSYFTQLLGKLGLKIGDIEFEVAKSLEFVRLKRNRLLHASSPNLSKTISELVKADGREIGEFWKEKIKAKELDQVFSKKENFDDLNEVILIELFNLFRYCAAMIDSSVITREGEQNILNKMVIPEFISLKETELRNWTNERILSKFKSYCRAEFGALPNSETLEKLLDEIVV